MERIAFIGVAGALGALSRYALQGWVNDMVGRPSVLGTLVVNITGAFALGLVISLTEDRYFSSASFRAAITIGFLGAYTTFSTLMFESVDRLETGDIAVGLANIGGSVLLGMIAVYGGLTLGRSM